MKRKFLVFAASALLSLSSNAAVGDTFEIDNLLYTVLTESENSNTVSVKNALADYSLSGDIVIPAEVSDNETTYTVTSIAIEAFIYCTDITSVSIPATITSIPNGDVFALCTSLESINVDPENTSYCSENGVLYNKNKTRLISCPKTFTGEFTIPASVTTLESFCFTDCTKLTSAPIPSTVTTFGMGPFIRCKSLTSLTIPASTKPASSNVYICFDTPLLESITVEEGNTSICSVDGVVYNSAQDKLIQYPAAKKGDVKILESVTSYGNYSLAGVQALTSFTVPAEITSFSNNILRSCPNLTEINVDEGNTSYSSEDGVLFNKDKTNLISFPSGKSGEYTVPDGVTTISSAAFSSSKISNIELPSSVTNYGGSFFGNCGNLTKIIFNNPTPPSSFTRLYFRTARKDLTLYVPEESVEAYKEAFPYWENIKAIGEADIVQITSDANSAIDYSMPLSVYDLAGKHIADSLRNLAPGLYIVRQKAASAKILVK
ncbi:MAG: leucine-rich repeat domain-containing protein [Bacteroides sp.]|nr:leucine-rich repeat domain-containing protein [Bacteroides sp.]